MEYKVEGAVAVEEHKVSGARKQVNQCIHCEMML